MLETYFHICTEVQQRVNSVDLQTSALALAATSNNKGFRNMMVSGCQLFTVPVLSCFSKMCRIFSMFVGRCILVNSLLISQNGSEVMEGLISADEPILPKHTETGTKDEINHDEKLQSKKETTDQGKP